MRIFTTLIGKHLLVLTVLLFFLHSSSVFAQTSVSWTGVTSSDWNTASNWSPAAVPGASTNVTIGDASFTGTNQPIIDEIAIVNVGSINLIGTTKAVHLIITNDYNVVINGDVTIGSNTTLENSGTNVQYKGNFTNNGTYTETTYFVNKGAKGRYFPSSEFQGSGVTIGGSNPIYSSHVLVSGTATLATNLVIKALVLPADAHPQMKSTADLKVSGTFNPSTKLVSWDPTVTRSGEAAYTGDFVVEAGGTAKVMATTYAGNYGQVATIYPTSIIDYAATSGTQTVLARAYGILRISGGGVKELEGNTTVSDVAASTQLLVDAGTLDLKTFTLNRTGSATPIAGGTLTLANGATLRIGGTNTFPAGYQTRNLGSTSTVEYYGTNQTVSNELYGNLSLTSVAASVKTLPSAAMTISGNLSASGYASFTALGNISINGNVTLSDNASFDGGTGFAHTLGGNWTNNANFTGNTSTVILTGTAKAISRTASTTASLKNEFNNLTVTGAGTTISIPAGATLTINGDLSTTGAGTLSQASESLTMAGTSKTISGANISLNDLRVNGSTTTNASFIIKGNLDVSGSLTATGGTIQMTGASKSITATGALVFFGLRFPSGSTIATSSSFKVNSDLSGSGTLTATTPSVITFDGTSTFAGAHNLFNVTVNASRSLTMVANANMGVAGALTTTGTLNVVANVPNTITFNGTSAQSVLGREYNNIVFANAGAKTAGGDITVNGNLTISASSNFSAGAFTHIVKGNWINSGTFTSGTSTVAFTGSANTTITGITTFNALTVNKGTSSNFVTLLNEVTTNNLNLMSGSLRTGATKVKVFSGRSGTGWVVGTMTRVVSGGYVAGSTYNFNGPESKITFGTVSGITEVSMTSGVETATNFIGGAAINRLYSISIPAGSYADATIQLQYEESELNGNDETKLGMYKAAAGSGPWSQLGSSSRDEANNFVYANAQSDISGYWAIAETPNVHEWVGGTSTAWETGTNWRVRMANGSVFEPAAGWAPGVSDIAKLGTSGRVNQPTISTAVSVKGVQFSDAANITLTLGGASSSLSTVGNLAATGTSSIRHTIETNARNMSVGGNLNLSEGSNLIDIVKTTGGGITVAGDINQDGSSITLGNGILKVGGNYNYRTGTFNAGTSTVEYYGGGSQSMALVNYHNVTVSKPSGVATLSSSGALTIGGALTHNGAGSLALNVINLTLSGNLIQSSGSIDAGETQLTISGNWNVSGSGVFVPGTSAVTFIGGNAQTISQSTFNQLIVAKTSGTTLSATGNIGVNADLNVQSGIVDLSTYTLNRSAVGGTMTLANGATLALSGANNFPSNFNTYTIGSTSTVEYKGTVAQSVKGITYGNLTLSNGGTSNVKSLADASTIAGTLLVNSGAKLNANNQVLTIGGNFTVNGEFSPGTYTSPTPPTGTLILAPSFPTMKYISGNLEVNNMVVKVGAYYTLSSSTLKINGDIDIDGNGNVYNNPDAPAPLRTLNSAQVPNNGFFNAMSTSVTIDGNFKNSGMMFSNGTAKFLGGRSQTIQLLSPIIPWESTPPTVEFAGAVSPVLNSTKSPEFGSVIISNTSGVTASVGWTVFGELKVNGGKFFGGSYTHNVYTAITNGGIITSSGVINFEPIELGRGLGAHPFYMGANPAYFQSTGTVRIGGTNLVALSGSIPAVLNNLVIANTNAAGVGTFLYGPMPTELSPLIPAISGTAWNLGGDFRIESGAKFTAGVGTTYSIGGNLVNNGTLAGSYGSFTLTNAIGLANSPATNATIEGAGAITMANLTIGTNAKVEVKQNLTINGNLSHNGAHFEADGVELNFATASPTVITSTSGSIDIENLKISKSTGAATLSTDLGSVQNIDVVSGTFDATSKVISEATSATSSLTVANGAVFKLSGEALPTLDDFSFAPTSTVNYYGTNPQTVKGDLQYGHLSLNGASTKTFNGTTTFIAGDFTVASDVTSVITPAAIDYNGSNAQTVAAVNYNNLTLSTSSAKTLAAGTVGVAGAFTNPGISTLNAVANLTTVDYNGAAQNVLTADYYNLKLSNSGVKTFAGKTGVANQFTLAGSAAADLTSTETTIDFNGTGAQVIPALNYSKVLLSAGGNKTLAGNANVAQELRLTNGKINTGSSKFTLGNTASLVETKDHYVTGFVETQRNMTAAMESFGGLGISVTPMVAPGLVTVVRETGAPIVVASGNSSIARNYSFGVSGTNSDLNATVTFEYYPHELNGLEANTLQLATSADGTTWKMHGKSVSDPIRNSVGANTVNSLQRMTLGSSVTPLPVELKYLRAEKAGQHAVITWETAAEENNKGFEVEVSLDGVNYRKLGFVSNGAVASRGGSLYTYTDKEAGKAGIRYYRLKQLDLDGKYTYYGPRSVAFELQQAVSLVVFPNPVKDQIQVRFSALNTGITKAALYTLTGIKIHEETLSVESGVNTKQLQVAARGLSTGVYMLVLEINGERQSIKVVKE